MTNSPAEAAETSTIITQPASASVTTVRKRRGKRMKQGTFVAPSQSTQQQEEHYEKPRKTTKKKKSNSAKRHQNDQKSGGLDALLPSLAGVTVLIFILMGHMGFRGRVSVAGIDLGTTNSVICIQALSKTVGEIECIKDPFNGSPIIPSVVSFLEQSSDSSSSSHSRKKKEKQLLDPDPSHVVVGQAAKLRIDSHPHHTLYHAKRVLGRPFADVAVEELRHEVEFDVMAPPESSPDNMMNEETALSSSDSVLFRVPFRSAEGTQNDENMLTLLPQKVGSYIVNHLMQLAHAHLGHDNVKSAVICIPAKFNAEQRAATVEAFRNAGVSVARILEEPTAAALAYGLDKKENINFILVYDFGGGTLDVSLLQVADGGYVDVMGSDGDDRLGGADFDAAVARHLLENNISGGAVRKVTNAMKEIEVSQTNEGDDYDLEEMLHHSCVKLQSQPLCTLSSFHTIAEKMKIGLSAYTDGEGGIVEEYCLGLSHDVDLPIMSMDQFCDALQPIQLQLTTAEFDVAVNALYERSILPVRRLLQDLNLQRDEIDEVVMVGGTTRMPQIREIVRKELGVLSLNTHIDPDLTVAYGAASVI
eukprot:CAMPEP_0198293192 /NCGR_PEP_ID=MMETSP1449-20131203/16036_1 /TAXON_ID=420275 /ORGANISM="Attheya septentrionalis, Strain CCMP2084" /LENGTH=588 /DNA_ID=CAMNT_0043992703 /DNA_START=235 /DNA_END=1998 /DNA_ORIENTATION=+